MNSNYKSLNTVLKLIAVLLLLSALLKLNYNFYQFIRISLFMDFALLAYLYIKNKSDLLAVLFALLALLFQPFLKVALGRSLWFVVDIAAAAGILFLFVSEIINNRKLNNKE